MSMTENESEDASSEKRFKICDNAAPWSNLNHDMLYLVMMKLGDFDFQAFSGVCKSWRSFAISNKKKFMDSRPSMSLSIPSKSKEEDYYCYLDDIEGRSFNAILPHSGGRICVGVSCDHLILFGKETNDFWLLNPFTRHGFHFPDIPSSVSDNPQSITGKLVFSPSKSVWVLVVTDETTNVWFSIAGEGTWNHVSSTSPIVDLEVLKGGRIFAIDNAHHLCEVALDPEPKVIVLETKNFPISTSHWLRVSYDDILHLEENLTGGFYQIHRLDFEEMNWVLVECPKRPPECIHSKLRHNAQVKYGKGEVLICMINP